MVLALGGCAATKPADSRSEGEPTRVVVPAGDKATFVIIWDPSAVSRPESALWLGYLMYHVEFRIRKAMTKHPYGIQAPTFDEEVWARGAAAQTYVELRQKDPELNVRYFNDLSRVRDAGFLREYVSVFLNQGRWSDEPTGLRSKEFDDWCRVLADHRVVTYGQVSLEQR
jgi:hypothetical protein